MYDILLLDLLYSHPSSTHDSYCVIVFIEYDKCQDSSSAVWQRWTIEWEETCDRRGRCIHVVTIRILWTWAHGIWTDLITTPVKSCMVNPVTLYRWTRTCHECKEKINNREWEEEWREDMKERRGRERLREIEKHRQTCEPLSRQASSLPKHLTPPKGATIRLPGGGLGFSVWPEYFFLSLSGPKYFFSNYHEPEYFFSSHTGPEYFFIYNTNKFGSNFSVEPQIGFKTIIYWGCLLSVCVCVRPRWL